MNITIEDKVWRLSFDKAVTIEVIGALFKANFKLKSGIIHMSVDDLVKYLFYIDMNSLCETSRVVTGLSYYFNGVGNLRSAELYKLINDNKDLFSMYTNIYNRPIILIDRLNDISNDDLCTYTEELITNVYESFINYKDMAFDSYYFNKLFNTTIGVKKSLSSHIKYITLDFLIDELELDREGVIENSAFYNFRLKTI